MGTRECQNKGVFTTSGPLLGPGPKPLLTPTFTSRLLPFPVSPSTPTAPWKRAPSKWTTKVKAWTLPTLSAQGPAHYIHTETKGSIAILMSTVPVGSPAPQPRLEEKMRTSHVSHVGTPAQITLLWSGQRAGG